jgi:hypothetical protein
VEKAKISRSQLFTLMILFEFGSAFILPIAIEAKQDAWLSIMFGMIGGFLLFLVYYQLYRYYPDLLLVEFTQKIMGKWIVRFISLYFLLCKHCFQSNPRFWRHVIDICLSRYAFIYCKCLTDACCYLYRKQRNRSFGKIQSTSVYSVLPICYFWTHSYCMCWYN